jgi:hypothetical protein
LSLTHLTLSFIYPSVQPEGDDRYQKLQERFGSIWQTSFFRLTQNGIIRADNIDLIAKTIIYALQGMIMLSLSSNGTLDQESTKKELTFCSNIER